MIYVSQRVFAVVDMDVENVVAVVDALASNPGEYAADIMFL